MSSQKLMLPPLVVFCLYMMSCSNERMTGEQRVLDGIMVFTYGEDIDIPIDPYLIEEGMIFGTDQSEETYLLSRPFPSEISRDGTLYVIDIQEVAVHRFAPDGSHLGQFGRRGDGPGEFQLLQELIAENDQSIFP